MVERRHEGWHVPQRPPIMVAAATLALIVAMLLIAGWRYDRGLRVAHRGPVTTFPAPGIDTYIHDGVKDPHRPFAAPRRDPAIEAAKRSVAAGGLAGWAR